ncbi:MAG: hypothetical protein FWG34_03930 [Oscillospiraceae bacterium]|nr:hypothetical protein [Oscillospiraceae bacterium]
MEKYKNTAKLICLAVVLCAVVVSAVFFAAGCSKKNDSEAENREKSASDGPAQNETPAETEAPEIQPDLPEADFGGYEFTFLVRMIDDAHWYPYNPREIYAEEENAEPINDAVYRRNRYVEDKYNCSIKQNQTPNYAGEMQKTVKAGDDIYSVYYAAVVDLTSPAANGFFCDLFEIPHLDLGAPWWDRNAVKSLSIGRRLFFATSDLMIVDNDSTSTLVFNKKLIQEHALENPYELVRGNKWTLDKLIEMSRGVAQDLNGDGIMDYNDKFGFVGYRNAAFSLVHAADVWIAQKDKDDMPYFTLNTDKFFTVFDKACDLMYDAGSYNIHHLEGKFPEIYKISAQMFMEDRSLFYWILLHDIFDFRDMESDFGILPLPKYSGDQKEYYHEVNHYHGHALAIPVSVSDQERTGIILEALTAKSRYTLLPAYYDISLQRKFSRDEESREMLDIIFSSFMYDVGAINEWGSIFYNLVMMTMKNDRDIASKFEKYEAKALQDMQKTMDLYEKIGK